MRIIAGQYRRRIIEAPEGLGTRPMPDRIKEALFSMLGLRVQDAVVIDLFAGSGAVGLESLSRGARSCMFVEQGKPAAMTLQRNIDTLGCGDRGKVVLGDALGLSIVARAPRPVDLIFMDPPYPMVRDELIWPRVKAQAQALIQLLVPNGFLILRTPWPHILDGGGEEDEAPTDAEVRARKFKLKGKRDKKFTFERETTARGGCGARTDVTPPPADAPARGAARRSPKAPSQPSEPATGGKPKRHERLHRMDLTEELLDNEEFLGGRVPGPGAADLALVRNKRGEWVLPGEIAGEAGVLPLPPGFLDAVAKQNARKELADLCIDGARGPETHVYGNMAVHFFMKQAEAAQEPAPGV